MVAWNFWNILGIGPWETYLWELPLIYDRKYYGKPSWAREKIALARVGNVQLELVQPVEGGSIYRDFLLEHVLSANPILAFLMNLVNPIVVRAMGPNINRKTVENVANSGLKVEKVTDLAAGIFKLIGQER